MTYTAYSTDTGFNATDTVDANDIIRVYATATIYANEPVPLFATIPAGNSTGAALLVDGTLISRGTEGRLIELIGSHISLDVGSTGNLSNGPASGFNPMIYLSGDRNEIRNHGTIASQSTDSVAIAFGGGSGALHNDGTITGEVGAITFSTGSANLLVNSGEIASTTGGAVSTYGHLTIQNTGTIVASADYALYTGSDGSLTVFNSGTITVTNGPLAIYGDALTDTIVNQGIINGNIDLFSGNDVFDGRGGQLNGTVYGGDGNDTFYVSSSDAVIVENFSAGAGGNDTLYSTVSFALIDSQFIETLTLLGTAQIGTGNAQANTINGNHVGNLLYGRGDNDTVNGEVGADQLYGGIGVDSLSGGEDDDRVDGGAGSDTVFGDDGDDQLRGRVGSDRLEGGNDDDKLYGGLTNDSLYGGAGDDLLQGGAGTDRLFGGSDSDTFAFVRVSDSKPGGTMDIVQDFAAADDVIDLSAIDAKVLTAASDAFAFIGTAAFTGGTAGQLRFSVAGANIVVQADVDGDAVADFELQVSGIIAITAAAFVL